MKHQVAVTLVFTVVFALTVCAGVAALLLIEQLFAGGILW